MAEPERFRINRPDVIHEILDGELVIVNLRNGAYYSLDPVGTVVWQEVERGSSEAEIVAEMLACFEGDAAVIEEGARSLLAELRREDLVTAAEGAPVADGRLPRDGRTAFAPPRLQKYTDMQELLLLDPIHEIDESGWPSRGT